VFLKVDDIYILVIGGMVHKIDSGNPLDNFKRLLTPFNQIHSYATHIAVPAAFIWQKASCKMEKDVRFFSARKSATILILLS